MLFPKQKQKKKTKKHHPSILQAKDGTCYLCSMQGNWQQHRVLHEHHIFGGPNRVHSEEYGLKVYLCLEHHTNGPEAVHTNANNAAILKAAGQRAFEETESREKFIKIFGKNYRGDL